MKSISIRIDTTNDAFGENWELEVVRILDELSTAVEHGRTPDNIKDFNGNRVCTIEYKE